MWTISLPLRIPVSRNKLFSLNLNIYRNTHFQTLNKAKQNFNDLARELLVGVPKLKACSLEYVLYPASRQLCDISNVCTVVDKFFSDALVDCGILEDDNYQFIADVRFRFGQIDKANPRAEVIIRSPDHQPKEEDPMKISTKTVTFVSLTRDDLVTAIREYVGKQVTLAPDAELDLQGLPSDVEFSVRLEQSSEAAPAAAPKGRAKKMDPKVAMTQVAEALKARESQTTEESTQEAEVAPEPAQAAEEPLTGASSPVVADDEPLPPAPAAPPAKGLFANFKRPNNG